MGKFYYLVHIQYLGFRYHGWLKQPGVKTVESMIEKTLRFILDSDDFKILGASRTDSKVSANHSAFELFIGHPLDIEDFLIKLNQNLPNDIRALKLEQKDSSFSIINAPKIKEYAYLFSFGQKCHPFSAPYISLFNYDLDIELMKKGALLFQGNHNFKQYCTKPSATAIFEREIQFSKIKKNDLLNADFFPEEIWAYHIHSKGFLRNQVRLIMGQLLRLGKGEIGLEFICNSLKGIYAGPLRDIAPASGLVLNKINFET